MDKKICATRFGTRKAAAAVPGHPWASLAEVIATPLNIMTAVQARKADAATRSPLVFKAAPWGQGAEDSEYCQGGA